MKKIGLIFFLILPLSVFCQKTKVEIVSGNFLEGFKTDSGELKRVIGNCQFKQDDVTLWCDTAILDSRNNKLKAVGRVRILQVGGVSITADRLNYDGNTYLAELFDNITLRDERGVLTTNRLNYRTDTQAGQYYNGGMLVDKDNVLTSKTGYYYANENNAFFKDSVVLKNPEYRITCDTLKYNTTAETSWFYGPTNIVGNNEILYCEKGYYNIATGQSRFGKNANFKSGAQELYGDSLVYNKFTGIGMAFGNITFRDTAEQILLKGHYARYNEKNEEVLVIDSALLIALIEGDSLFIHGDTMFSFKERNDTMEVRRVRAFHHVKMFKDDFQASADSLTFNSKDSVLNCFGTPVLWIEGSQLSGDTIQIKLKNGKMHKLYLNSEAFVIYPEEEDKNRFNQIRGRNMEGFFKNNQFTKLFVEGNGQSVYYAREDSGAYIGVNQSECSSMIIKFKDNRASQITFITQPDALFYPLEQISPQELMLRGFNWRMAEKPISRDDIFREQSVQPPNLGMEAPFAP
ncbi:MAG: lipopolysaccharide export system protein LptA [Sphingobacteriales bacterium]